MLFSNKFLLTFLIFFLFSFSQAQVTRYAFQALPGIFTPLSGATVPAPAGDQPLEDDNFENIPIGFPFDYLGTNYTVLSTSVNGWAKFTNNITLSTRANGYVNDLANGDASTRAMLAPFWDDLGMSTNTFSYLTSGTAPNRVFTAEWLTIDWNYVGSSAISFQLKLYEGSNMIEFVYRPEPNSPNSPSASIGLTDVGTGPGNFLSVNGTGSSPSVSSTVETNNLSTSPASGQIYRFFIPSNDVGPTALLSPSPIGCPPSTASIDVEITNFGVNIADFGLNNVTVTANITGPLTLSLASTINSGTLAPLASQTVNLGTVGTFTAGTYNFELITTYGPDQNALNDTLRTTLTILPNVTLPETVDFTGYTGANLGTAFPDWFEANGATVPLAGGSSWQNSNATQTTAFGFASARINLFFINQTDWLVSPKFIPVAGDVIKFDAALTAFGGAGPDNAGANPMLGTDDAVQLMISTDCGNTFTSIFTMNGATGLNDVFSNQLISLTPYAGQEVIVGFLATDGPVDHTPDYDFHIANVFIGTPPPIDMKCKSVDAPLGGCGMGMEDIVVTLQNTGLNPQSNVPVFFSLNGGMTWSAGGTFAGPLASGATVSYTLIPQANFATAGTYDIWVRTAQVGDPIASNDTAKLQIISIPTISTFPYIQNFESGNGGWNSMGTNNSWAFGTPAGPYISSAASGVNAWVTNLSGDYNSNELSYLVSPCIDLSGLATDPFLRFSHTYQTESCCDEGWVEYSFNGGLNWAKLGASGNGTNWYNDAGNNWWDGNATAGSGQWQSAQIQLIGLSGQANIMLRFVFSSDGSAQDDGFGVDDIQIFTCYGGVAGRWKGCIDGDWTNAQNWDNQLVPTAAIDVYIDPNAWSWPTLAGDVDVLGFDLPVGAQMDQGAFTIRAAGDVSILGKMNCNTGEIELNGTANQLVNIASRLENLANQTTGKATRVSTSSLVSANTGMRFDVTTPILLQSVDVYPNSSAGGNFDIELRNASNAIINTANIVMPVGTNNFTTGVPMTATLNFAVPAGAGYFLTLGARTGLTQLNQEFTGSAFPYATGGGELSVTEAVLNATASSIAYYYFYNWQIQTGNNHEGICGLEINKASGKALLADTVVVLDHITFTQGVLESPSANPTTGANFQNIFLTNTSPNSLSRTGGYFTGILARNIASGTNSDYIYPFGFTRNGSPEYAPSTLDFTGVAADEFAEMSFRLVDPTVNGLPLTDAGLQIDTTDQNSVYWILENSFGLSFTDYDITIHHDSLSVDPPANDLRVLKRPNAAAAWTFEGTHQAVASKTTQRTGLTTMSQFAIGFPFFAFPGLPVELLSFEGVEEGETALLKWTTTAEQNSSHFVLERSADGDLFESIGQIQAAGNSNSKLSYDFRDQLPLKGINHYRLKMVDANGEFTYSKNVLLLFESTDGFSISPNPFDRNLTIQLDNISEKSKIEIFAADGKLVHTEIFDGLKHKLELSDLAQGVYTYRLQIGKASHQGKLIKLKK